MINLTQRQLQLLKIIVEEFIETAEPVGSETIEKKSNLGVSPATIRNEMARLTQFGYLQKPHASSGRMPTSLGLKHYVKNLMTPKKLSVAEEVGVKERIWDYRNEFEKMLKEATKELSKRTNIPAMTCHNQGYFYIHGLSHLLDAPEFYDIDVTRGMLSLLDATDFWMEILERSFGKAMEDEDYKLVLGEDFGGEIFSPCGFVYQTYRTGPYRGIIGTFGPARINFPSVFPLVDYFAKLISETGR